MRILVTGGNAPGTSGTAYSLLSPAFLKDPPELVASDEMPLLHNPYFQKLIRLPNGLAQDYDFALEQICHSEKIDLVIPQTTAENAFFTQTILKNRNYAVAVLKSSNSTINLNSKVQTYEFVKQLRIANDDFQICRTFQEVKEFQNANPGRSFFLKADELSGGRGIVKVVSDISKTILNKASSFHVVGADKLEKIFDVLDNGAGVITQLEAEGAEFSIDCYRDENLSIAVPRTRDSVRAGVSQQTTVTRQEVLREFALNFGEKLDLMGIYGLQCILTSPNNFSFMECNPRIQGTMVASTVAGENIIARGARLALNLPQLPEQPIAWGSIYRRAWSGYGYDQNKFYEI
jgi:hypothetical protein